MAPLTTALEPDEIVVAVDFPGLPPGAGWGFEEFAQRRGDFAVAGAAAIVVMDGDTVTEARISLMGVHDTPLRATAGEQALIAGGIDAAAAAAGSRADERFARIGGLSAASGGSADPARPAGRD